MENLGELKFSNLNNTSEDLNNIIIEKSEDELPKKTPQLPDDKLKFVQKKLTELFTTEQSLCNSANDVYTLLLKYQRTILNRGLISGDYLQQIIDAYLELTKNPYAKLFEGGYFLGDDGHLRVESENLTQEQVEFYAGKVQAINRPRGVDLSNLPFDPSESVITHPEGQMAGRLGAQAFITMHSVTIEKIITRLKDNIPDNEVEQLEYNKIKQNYFAPAQRALRVSMICEDLNQVYPLQAFESILKKIADFVSDTEFLIGLQMDFLPDLEGFSRMVTLKVLTATAAVNLEGSAIVNPSNEDNEDRILDEKVMRGLIDGDKLKKGILHYGKLMRGGDQADKLEELVKAFQKKYNELPDLKNPQSVIEAINGLKFQVNAIVQRMLSSYVELFEINLSFAPKEFKKLFKNIKNNVTNLKQFLIEKGCIKPKSSSVREIKAGLYKMLDFISHSLQSNQEPQNLQQPLEEVISLQEALRLKGFKVDDQNLGEFRGNSIYLPIKSPSSDKSYAIISKPDVDALKEEAKFYNAVDSTCGYYEITSGEKLPVGFIVVARYPGKSAVKFNIHEWTKIEKLDFLEAVVKELKSLHDRGIILRDFKLNNIYYDKETKKASLFGFESALFMDKEDKSFLSTDGLFSFFKRKDHIAPELYGLGKKITSAVDMYSLGVLISQIDLSFTNYIDFLMDESPKNRPNCALVLNKIKLMKDSEHIQQQLEAIRAAQQQIPPQPPQDLPPPPQNFDEEVPPPPPIDNVGPPPVQELNNVQPEPLSRQEKSSILNCGLNALFSKYETNNKLSRRFFRKGATHNDEGLYKAGNNLLLIKSVLFSREANHQNLMGALYQAVTSYPKANERARSWLIYLKATYKEIGVLSDEEKRGLFEEKDALNNIVLKIHRELNGPNKLSYVSEVNAYFSNNSIQNPVLQPVVMQENHANEEKSIRDIIHQSFSDLRNHFTEFSANSRTALKWLKGGYHTEKGISRFDEWMTWTQGLLSDHRLYDGKGNMKIEDFLGILERTLSCYTGQQRGHSGRTYVKILHDRVFEARSNTNESLGEILPRVTQEIIDLMNSPSLAEEAKILAWSS